MKQIIFLSALSVFFICKKDKNDDPGVAGLTGKWQFIKSQGGMNGTTVVTSPAGTLKYLIFKANFSYQITNNDQIEKSGVFNLSKAESNLSKKEAYFIQFDSEGIKKTYVVSHDSLMINDDHPDGYGNCILSQSKQGHNLQLMKAIVSMALKIYH